MDSLDSVLAQRAREIFRAVLGREPGERDSFLDQACGGDELLREEVESLLEYDRKTGSLLDRPVEGMRPEEDVRDMIGRTVGHYRILEELGAGGMGVVYKARDTRLERWVALKFLPRQQTDARSRQRFVREARAASALDHPNICTIYEIGEAEEGELFIAMACYEGSTLDRRIARGPLEIGEAVDLTIQAAEGLAEAHEKEIVHRDVKPSNIMVTRDGHVKLLDFGLAKLRGSARITQEGALLGTVDYMSPEQLEGEDLDPGTDIWSLGVVVFEMLTGSRPFAAGTAAGTMRAILDRKPRSLRELRPEAPAALAAAVRRSLAKKPEERYPEMRKLLADLSVLAPTRLRYVGRSFAIHETSTPRTPESSNRELPTAPRPNLPTPPTPLIGREKETREALDLLRRPEVRLVTFTGPGGIGKTRLSLRVAERLVPDFADGVFFVPLAAVRDPERVTDAIARSLGLAETGSRLLFEKLCQELAPKRLLLVLDNFERVVAAAPSVAAFLRGCPSIKVLVTSRMLLRLRGEHELPVPPLPVPDPRRRISFDSFARYPAIQLFVERAQAARHDFVLGEDNVHQVAELCARLDGLPLALELAAARVKLLSLTTISKRLDHRFELLKGGPRDAPRRHQTLRRAIAGSHELLAAREQILFRRLGVFAAGWTLEAAEAVCAAESGIDAVEGLTVLVEGSLVRRSAVDTGETRFSMLETIREYARECLAASGEEQELRRRHLGYYLTLVREMADGLGGDGQKLALEAIEAEHDNLRLALDWSETDEESAVDGLRLAACLWRFWLIRGYLSEGRQRLDRLLAGAAAAPTEVRAQLLEGEATLAHNQGDLAAATAALEDGLELWKELGHQRGIASCLTELGWLAWRRCDYGVARSLSQQSLDVYRDLGDSRGTAQCLTNLGWISLFQGDLAQALASARESLALRREIGDRRGVAFCQALEAWTLLRQGSTGGARELLTSAIASFRELGDRQLTAFATGLLAMVAAEEGDFQQASDLARGQALPGLREVGDRWGVAFALTALGDAAIGAGDRSAAGTSYEESLALRRKIGDRWGEAVSLSRLAELCHKRGDLPAARQRYQQSLELRRALGDKDGIAQTLAGLARSAAENGELDEAARLLAAVEAILAAIGAPLPRRLRGGFERSIETVRDGLDAATLEACQAAGRALADEELAGDGPGTSPRRPPRIAP